MKKAKFYLFLIFLGLFLFGFSTSSWAELKKCREEILQAAGLEPDGIFEMNLDFLGPEFEGRIQPISLLCDEGGRKNAMVIFPLLLSETLRILKTLEGQNRPDLTNLLKLDSIQIVPCADKISYFIGSEKNLVHLQKNYNPPRDFIQRLIHSRENSFSSISLIRCALYDWPLDQGAKIYHTRSPFIDREFWPYGFKKGPDWITLGNQSLLKLLQPYEKQN